MAFRPSDGSQADFAVTGATCAFAPRLSARRRLPLDHARFTADNLAFVTSGHFARTASMGGRRSCNSSAIRTLALHRGCSFTHGACGCWKRCRRCNTIRTGQRMCSKWMRMRTASRAMMRRMRCGIWRKINMFKVQCARQDGETNRTIAVSPSSSRYGLGNQTTFWPSGFVAGKVLSCNVAV